MRVMPNTPCVVGECASAFAANTNATAADIGLVSQLLSAVGLAVHVPVSDFERYRVSANLSSTAGCMFV